MYLGEVSKSRLFFLYWKSY